MATALEKRSLSVEDFLEGELVADRKHEYIGGQVYAMAGGKANHDALAGNFRTEAGQGLKGKRCRPFGSDFMVRVPLSIDGEAFYYPDGMITCEPVGGDDRFTEKPVVILEVLSDSTRRHDEVRKLRDYFTLSSLEVYLLAEADEPTVRIYRRSQDGFTFSFVSGIDAVLELPEVELSIPLAELYRDVELLEEKSIPS
jgi:Uma2 family endonuclease